MLGGSIRIFRKRDQPYRNGHAQLKAVVAAHGVLDALSQELESLRANLPILQGKLKQIAAEAD